MLNMYYKKYLNIYFKIVRAYSNYIVKKITMNLYKYKQKIKEYFV